MAQQSSIRGIVSIHNSETFTGKRQYVANAEVEDDFKKATSAITNSNGEFSLVFVGVNEKRTVFFQVKKNGLEVVDKTKLSAVAGQEDVINISMANPDSMAAYRYKLFDIGKTQAQKSLEKALQEKSRQLALLTKDAQKNSDTIKKLQQEYAALEDQSKKIDEQAEELSRKYSQVNLDDVSLLFKRAFLLFQSGELDSALAVLSNANVTQIVSDIISEREKINTLQKEISARDSIQKAAGKDAAKSLLLKADLHKTKFEFDSTEECYELLLKLEPGNNEFLFSYAYFLGWLKQFDKAIHYYEEALKIRKRLVKDNPQVYEPEAAILQNNLGNLYHDKKEFIKAETALLDALEIFRRLAKDNPQVFEPDVAASQTNLGFLYSDKKEFIKAETACLEALEISKRLAKDNPQVYEPAVARFQNNLGNLYADKKEYIKAETAYLESLEIKKRLAKDNPQVYEPDVAITQNNLGVLYRDKNEFIKAETACLEALEIRKRLAKDNPQVYEPDVAMTQNHLGILYRNKKEYIKAETAYLEVLEIYKRLAKDNPQVYEPDVATLQNNLGNLYDDKKEYIKAETAHLEALEIHKRLARTDSGNKDFRKVFLSENKRHLYHKY